MNLTRKQHYVWRKYLRAWAPDEQIWCLRAGKIFSSNLMGVGQQRDFYRLSELSAADIKFLRDFCSKQPADLQRINMNWVGMFNRIFELKNKMLEIGADAERLQPVIDAASIQTEELLQGAIEQKGVVPLEALLKGDLAFFRDISAKIGFIHFLCVQYTRTKAMRARALSDEYRLEGQSTETIWNVMAHIIATSLGASLIREQYDLYLLRNHTSVPLITADQPVINIHASAVLPGKAVKDLDLYYPISPTLAVLLALTPPDDSSLEEADVRRYNALMAYHSHEQIYASDCADLEQFASTVQS